MELKPVLEELERVAGSQLDPGIVEIFLDIVHNKEEFEDVYYA